MGLFEFYVEEISVETVPKLVLFDRSDRDESASDTGETTTLSPVLVAGGALLGTALAVGGWLVARRLGDLDLHC